MHRQPPLMLIKTVAENSNALTGLLTSIDVDGNDGTTFALVSAAVDGADPVKEVSGPHHRS